MSEDLLEALHKERIAAREDYEFCASVWGEEDARTRFLRWVAAKAYRDYLDALPGTGHLVRAR